MSMVYQYAPNPVNALYNASESGAWKIIASDGSSYSTLALLTAAGKNPYPYLGAGMFLQYLTLRSENGSGAAGSGFYYQTGVTTAPSDFSKATWVAGGTPEPIPGPVRYLWVYKTVSGDRVFINGAH